MPCSVWVWGTALTFGGLGRVVCSDMVVFLGQAKNSVKRSIGIKGGQRKKILMVMGGLNASNALIRHCLFGIGEKGVLPSHSYW